MCDITLIHKDDNRIKNKKGTAGQSKARAV